MIKTKHQENCTAPLCNDDVNTNTVWCAGEEICSKTPRTKIQQRQKRINEEFKKGKMQDKSWTLSELSRSSL